MTFRVHWTESLSARGKCVQTVVLQFYSLQYKSPTTCACLCVCVCVYVHVVCTHACVCVCMRVCVLDTCYPLHVALSWSYKRQRIGCHSPSLWTYHCIHVYALCVYM